MFTGLYIINKILIGNVKRYTAKIYLLICKFGRYFGIQVSNSGIFTDDKQYRKYFEKNAGHRIYTTHLNSYRVCCSFCRNLKKSQCHEYCFSCSKGTYNECSPLLPGTFSFSGAYFDSVEKEYVPWIFKTPCAGFERLNHKKYYRNFVSLKQSVTVANYEVLEGLFTGICREKRPCHICASVNISIFNKCAGVEKNIKNRPCDKIIDEIAKKYRSVSGLIKYDCYR